MVARSHEDVVLKVEKNQIKPPRMFKVVLLNDDFTPMEFVVLVLQTFFAKGQEKATQIMLKVHMDGIGVCGVYSNDVAETKVKQVVTFARKNQHPLKCVMEET
jgi:ATP-dependent Clp protease adaptor protein ClpS